MDMTEMKSKANDLFAKLPFRAWAERIPAGAREKFPLLEKAIPWANQIAAGLAVVLVVTVIACSGGGGSKKPASIAERLAELEQKVNTAELSGDQKKAEQYMLEVNKLRAELEQAEAAAAEKAQAAAQKSAVLAPESDFNVILNQAGDGAVITGYTGPGGNIIIPATIQGMPVVWVEMNPPMQKVGTGRYITNDTINSIQDVDNFGKKQEIMKDANASLISVVIPEGVRGVGGFQDCAALRSVTLPDSVWYIAAAAFKDCTSLVSINIPDSVKVIDGKYSDGFQGAFQGCTSLASITIPEGVEEINMHAFQRCTSLTSITIPGSVKTIGKFAVSDCTSLASVVIQEGVTQIGECMFYRCTSLASVTIPDSVTMIDNAAFKDCTNLTSVTISPIKRKWEYDNAFRDCPKVNLASQAALKAAGYTGGFH